VDNNSTDDTPGIVDRFIGARPRSPLRAVRETSQGLIHARTRGMRECSSPLIAFIDDDIVIEPGWSDAIARRFATSPAAGVVGGRIEMGWESGPTELAYKHRHLMAYQDLGDQPLRITDPRGGVAGAAFAMRVEALEAADWPSRAVLTDRVGARTSSCGDFEIAARLREQGYEVWDEPGAACTHLIGAHRQTERYLLDLAAGIAESWPWFEWVCEGEPKGDEGLAWARAQLEASRRRLKRDAFIRLLPRSRRFRLTKLKATIRGYEGLIDELARDRANHTPS